MPIYWESIFINLGLFGTSISALTWLLKKLGEHLIDRKLKDYEKELNMKSRAFQNKLDSDLETHKAQLNIEHTQYQKLQEKRLAIMAEIYKKITELDNAMQILILEIKPLDPSETPNSQMIKDIQIASDAYKSFTLYYLNHRIFFSEENCNLLDELKTKYWDSLWYASTRQRLGSSDFEYNRKTLEQASETVRKEIPPIMAVLEKDFRLSLGVR